ncbi:hypothetical protein ACFYOK_03875 [Microbispora bryophytorum]|uniref:hypothetical protein n=1 Tax=Microbispora bryophytorum TaxID=1460882 RepID=UPI0033F97F7D
MALTGEDEHLPGQHGHPEDVEERGRQQRVDLAVERGRRGGRRRRQGGGEGAHPHPAPGQHQGERRGLRTPEEQGEDDGEVAGQQRGGQPAGHVEGDGQVERAPRPDDPRPNDPRADPRADRRSRARGEGQDLPEHPGLQREDREQAHRGQHGGRGRFREGVLAGCVPQDDGPEGTEVPRDGREHARDGRGRQIDPGHDRPHALPEHPAPLL